MHFLARFELARTATCLQDAKQFYFKRTLACAAKCCYWQQQNDVTITFDPRICETKKAGRMAKRCADSCNYEYTDSLCRLAEVFLAFASGVLTMVTFGTPYWLERGSEVGSDTDHYHLGLWQNCTILGGCTRMPMKGPSVPGERRRRGPGVSVSEGVGTRRETEITV